VGWGRVGEEERGGEREREREREGRVARRKLRCTAGRKGRIEMRERRRLEKSRKDGRFVPGRRGRERGIVV